MNLSGGPRQARNQLGQRLDDLRGAGRGECRCVHRTGRHANGSHPRGHGRQHVERAVADAPGSPGCDGEPPRGEEQEIRLRLGMRHVRAVDHDRFARQPQRLDRRPHLLPPARGGDRPRGGARIEGEQQVASSGQWCRVEVERLEQLARAAVDRLGPLVVERDADELSDVACQPSPIRADEWRDDRTIGGNVRLLERGEPRLDPSADGVDQGPVEIQEDRPGPPHHIRRSVDGLCLHRSTIPADVVPDRQRELGGARLMPIDPTHLDADPFRQFEAWLAEADGTGQPLATAFALATASADGAPSVRMVLLRGVDPDGLRFYTSRNSRKGRDLAGNPRAAAAFHWAAMGRQVRVAGPVSAMNEAESAAYWTTRPRASRLSASASEQGEEIASRDRLEARVAELDARYPGDAIPLPPSWGGYRLLPEVFEFWEERADRLHDRVEYLPNPDGGWRRRRLQP